MKLPSPGSINSERLRNHGLPFATPPCSIRPWEPIFDPLAAQSSIINVFNNLTGRRISPALSLHRVIEFTSPAKFFTHQFFPPSRNASATSSTDSVPIEFAAYIRTHSSVTSTPIFNSTDVERRRMSSVQCAKASFHVGQRPCSARK